MTLEGKSMAATVKLFERGQLKAFDVTFKFPFGEMTILGFHVIQAGTKAPGVGTVGGVPK